MVTASSRKYHPGARCRWGLNPIYGNYGWTMSKHYHLRGQISMLPRKTSLLLQFSDCYACLYYNTRTTTDYDYNRTRATKTIAQRPPLWRESATADSGHGERRVCASMRGYARVCASTRKYSRVCAGTREIARVYAGCAGMLEYARVCASIRSVLEHTRAYSSM